MVMAKSVEEAIKKVNGKHLYFEDDTHYWIAKEAGVEKVLKPLPLEQIKEKLLQGSFPEKYINAVLQKEKRKTKALEEALKSQKGLILSGNAGIGKTFACTYKIAKLLQEYKINAPAYISLQNFDINEIRKTHKEFDCYLIDDFNPNLNEWERKFATEIIYHAYNTEKLLFITTNASFKDLARFIAEEPVISRLLEMCEVKQIKDKDLRIKRR
jgi:DNA replication protein DnaC